MGKAALEADFWSWLSGYGFVVAAVNVVGAAAIFGTPDGALGVFRTRVAPPALALWIVSASVGMPRIGKSAADDEPAHHGPEAGTGDGKVRGKRDIVPAQGFGVGR
jgi:hypothetical protein